MKIGVLKPTRLNEFKKIRKKINYNSENPYSKLTEEEVISYSSFCFMDYKSCDRSFVYQDQQSPCQYICKELYILFIKTLSKIRGKEEATEIHKKAMVKYTEIKDFNGRKVLCSRVGAAYIENTKKYPPYVLRNEYGIKKL